LDYKSDALPKVKAEAALDIKKNPNQFHKMCPGGGSGGLSSRKARRWYSSSIPISRPPSFARAAALFATWDLPEAVAAEAVHDAALDREFEILDKLLATQPTTISGMAASLEKLGADPYWESECYPDVAKEPLLFMAVNRRRWTPIHAQRGRTSVRYGLGSRNMTPHLCQIAITPLIARKLCSKARTPYGQNIGPRLFLPLTPSLVISYRRNRC
jgi:hypothetical protein